MPTIDNANLVGFWPMNEPSGAPMFHNYAPNFAGKPNGVSYNLHVHTINNIGVNNPDLPQGTAWPGGGSLVNVGSGLTHTGYKVQGAYNIATNNEHEKCLIFGKGGSANRASIYNASTVNLGFSVGFWVLPVTDGRSAGFEDGGAAYTASRDGTLDLAYQHALMSQYSQDAQAKEGFWIGVSGQLAGSTPGDLEFSGPHALRAYVLTMSDSPSTSSPQGNDNAAFISTPIESGRYTHLTMTYEYIGSQAHIVSLYKDGTLVGSDTTHARLTNDSAISAFEDSTLSIGGSITGTADAPGLYQEVTGWGHLVSGIYAFNDILTAGEVTQMHDAGGLQPNEGVAPSGKPVEIGDPSIIGYYPNKSIGFPDVSSNHFPLIAAIDEGNNGGGYSVATGPFGGGAAFSRGVQSIAAIAGSGTMAALAAARSFTIAGNFSPRFQITTDQNLMFSLGSLVGRWSRGMKLTTTTGPTIRLEVYPLNDSSTVVNFDDIDTDYYENVLSHYAVVYDDQTNGVALYLDGALANSGTLDHSFGNALNNLVGSGYPLTFLGGTLGHLTNPDLDVPDGFSTVPFRNAGSNFFIAGRPLEPLEISYLAQSGIYLGGLSGTLHDPRLCGYWPCDDFVGGDLYVADRASAWSDIAGPLTRAESDDKWDAIFGAGQFSGPFTTLGHDLFGDATNSALGISSGVWVVQGGSRGSMVTASNIGRRSSAGNLSRRYKPVLEERDMIPQNYLGEYIVSFEVTADGNIPLLIPSVAADQNNEFNSTIFNYGDGGASIFNAESRFRAYLTTFNAIDTDTNTSLIFTGQNTHTTMRPLVSGTVTPATTHRVLLHSKFQSPYTNEATGTANLQIDLYIDGTKVDSLTETAINAFMWSNGDPGGSTDDAWVSFGGVSTDTLIGTSVARNTGLGENSLREIFIMRGHFEPLEVQQLAINGINKAPSIAGIANALPTTQVTTGNADIVGYYRFSGGPRGSGELDLSGQGNNLRILGDELVRNNVMGDEIGATHQLKYIPGPHKNADIAVQASGISWIGQTPTGNISPFATSGIAFDTPDLGFSVGMWYANRGTNTTTTHYHTLVCYGIAPEQSDNAAADVNRSWIIAVDNRRNIKLILSNDGHMRINDFSELPPDRNGQTICGIFDFDRSPVTDDTVVIETYKRGDFEAPHKDSWSHIAWTYNPVGSGTVKAYLNGELVDEIGAKGAGLQIPTDPTARMITFLSPPNDDGDSNPWNWDNIIPRNIDSTITDFFYFSDELTDREVRYIAQNGIDEVFGTPTSGIIGGYLQGQDTASGIIGGFEFGQDTTSGIIGGMVDGSIAVSGMIGGFVSGVVFGDGTIGGFIPGLDFASGIIGGLMLGSVISSGMIAGYMQGSDTASGIIGGIILGSTGVSGILGGFTHGSDTGSGIIGGFLLGGLERFIEFDGGFTVEVFASANFDSQVEVRQENATDFDAKVVIFQDECPPLIDIPIPLVTVSGQVPPFNQYFIGKASGQQGKTITQARWTFGDFTAATVVAESGAGCYPIQHNFATSGFYAAKFEAIDSDGIHASVIRFVNIASGISPSIISLSGVPQAGNTVLTVDFSTSVDNLPAGVSRVASLLDFDDGQSTIGLNPTHSYSEPGVYKPVWCIRDSRGFVWCDSLNNDVDLLQNGGTGDQT